MRAILIPIAVNVLFCALAGAQSPRYRVAEPARPGGTFLTAPTAGSALGAKVFPLEPSSHGNPEGIAWDPASRAFFVGTIGDGTIYRGTLEGPDATPFVPGGDGLEAAGLKVARGKLYVAGGFSCAVRVDLATKQMVASFETAPGGMLNDLVVTRQGDVFVTDSFRPVLWRIPAAMVEAGAGDPEAIPLDPEIPYVFSPDPFNLNGIVAMNGGRRLIVVQSNTGKLFRIDLDDSAPLGREIREIAVEPLYGDGLLLDKGHLLVVTFLPQEGLAFVKLDDQAQQGTVVDFRTDPKLRGPSTVARARYFYLLVNLDFATSTVPFTVTGLPRNDDEDDDW